MPAQVNATLTDVHAAGVKPDWDRAGSAGAAKWSGVLEAYYREKEERITDGGAVNVVLRRELIIDTDGYDELELDTDDTITFAREDGLPQTARAVSIRRADLDGIPAELRTTLITLEDG